MKEAYKTYGTLLSKQIFKFWGFQKEKEAGKDTENLCNKVIAENCPSLGKGMDIQIQSAQKSPNRFSPKRSSLWHILVKLSKAKDHEGI